MQLWHAGTPNIPSAGIPIEIEVRSSNLPGYLAYNELDSVLELRFQVKTGKLD